MDIKIAVMCCTLNEERNIERYCEVYSRFADNILICDGGSIDLTVKLAERFQKVRVVHFKEQMELGGFRWNPKGKQHNFGYAAAMEHDPDWMITDECDSIPTLELQKNIRSIMKTYDDFGMIGVHRLYLVGDDKYYPDLSFRGHFGWAHQPRKIDARYDESDHLLNRRPLVPKPDTWHTLDSPYVLLHYGWPDEETVDFKTRLYRAVGELPFHGKAIPRNAGNRSPLPEWAKWN